MVISRRASSSGTQFGGAGAVVNTAAVATATATSTSSTSTSIIQEQASSSKKSVAKKSVAKKKSTGSKASVGTKASAGKKASVAKKAASSGGKKQLTTTTKMDDDDDDDEDEGEEAGDDEDGDDDEDGEQDDADGDDGEVEDEEEDENKITVEGEDDGDSKDDDEDDEDDEEDDDEDDDEDEDDDDDDDDEGDNDKEDGDDDDEQEQDAVEHASAAKGEVTSKRATISSKVICSDLSQGIVFDESIGQDLLSASAQHLPQSMAKISFLSPTLAPDAEQESELLAAAKGVVKRLLVNWKPRTSDGKAFSLMRVNLILELCQAVAELLQQEPVCVPVGTPTRVFGDIHGQLRNLLDLFQTYGSPDHYKGDVNLVNYVFNGDFVDRGPNSLEVVVLLFSIKLLYPKRVFLIRGNHEDRVVNETNGFKKECDSRLPHGQGTPVWEAFNNAFQWLPLAARIGERILCLHGGIGARLKSIRQLNSIARPITGASDSKLITDVLWSDPTSHDGVLGVHANARGIGVVHFGPDKVISFCERNQIDVIIRSHQCVAAGYEFFASGHMVTVFSATSYMSKFDNHGAILEITTDLLITPRTIKS